MLVYCLCVCVCSLLLILSLLTVFPEPHSSYAHSLLCLSPLCVLVGPHDLCTLYPFPDCGVVSVLRAHLLEQTIQCLLIKGDAASSADKVLT
jgi:hypothetical protein